MSGKRLALIGAGLVALVVAIVFYGVSRVSTTQAQEVTPVETRVGGVSVSGEGKAEGRPDTAYLNLGFSAENSSLAAAREEAAKKMDSVLAKIKSLGVAEKDIQTSNYSVYRDQERDVFVVGNDVRVTIRNVESSSKLLDEAIDAGANSVHGISFGIEDRTALEKQAREKALQDARARAEELARLGGVRLGEPVAISEGMVTPPPIIYQERAMAQDSAGAASTTPIEPGQLEVSIQVQVTYAIR